MVRNDVKSGWRRNSGKDYKYQVLKSLVLLFVGNRKRLKKFENEDRDVI